MSKLLYPAIFHPEREEGGYSVTVPDLEGCFSEGDTLEEAYDMTKDAIGLCLEELASHGASAPVPTEPVKIQGLQAGDFVALVEFDSVAYSRIHHAQSVKKTLTIPEWLNDLAVSQNVNFSKVLQDALMEQLRI